MYLYIQDKISRTFNAILRHQKPGRETRHKPLPREPDGSIRLDTILKNNPKLRSYCGIRGLLLLASIHDNVKTRTIMAITYEGEPDGPPPKESPKWMYDINFDNGIYKDKKVKHIYFQSTGGQTYSMEDERRGDEPHEEEPEVWTRPTPKAMPTYSDDQRQKRKDTSQSSEQGFTAKEAMYGEPKCKPAPKMPAQNIIRLET